MHTIVKKLSILLVEDNLEHAKLIQLILSRKNVRAQVVVARDGVEAMSYLSGSTVSSPHKKSLRPDIILLDLNMPRTDGRDVLRQVKSNQYLKDVPVVVVSTSDKEADRISSAHVGASAYISKSAGFDALSEMLSRVTELTHFKKTSR